MKKKWKKLYVIIQYAINAPLAIVFSVV